MEYSTIEQWQGESENGIIYTIESLYDHFQEIGDPAESQREKIQLGKFIGIDISGEDMRSKYAGGDSGLGEEPCR